MLLPFFSTKTTDSAVAYFDRIQFSFIRYIQWYEPFTNSACNQPNIPDLCAKQNLSPEQTNVLPQDAHEIYKNIKSNTIYARCVFVLRILITLKGVMDQISESLSLKKKTSK